MNNFFQYFKNIFLSVWTKTKQVFLVFKKKGILLCLNFFFLLLFVFVLGTLLLLISRFGFYNLGILIIFGLVLFFVSILFNANTYYILKDEKNEFKIHFKMFKKDFLSILLNNLFVFFLLSVFFGFTLLAGKSLGTLNSFVELSILQQIGFHFLNILSLVGIFLFFKYIFVSVFVFIDIYIKNHSINSSFKRINTALKGKYMFVLFHFLPFVLLQFAVEKLFGTQSIFNVLFSWIFVLFIMVYIYLVYLDIIKE